MSHAEMWDDSILVDSWNEALEEYKKYHGIHARGERVGDIWEISKNSNKASDEMDYDGEVDVKQGISDPQAKIAHESADPVQTTSRNTEQSSLAQNSPDKLSEKNQTSAGPAVPQHLIGQVQDEALKNLLMSWYYAGYYTGLYEGQQGQKPKPA